MQKYPLTRLSLNSFTDIKLFAVSFVFVVANVITPVIIHRLIPEGGPIFLPLYFFSLLAGLIYGWRCGLVTGLISPLLSFLLTGMPPQVVLPFVVLKSIVLGTTGGYLSKTSNRLLPIFPAAISVILMQLVGIGAILIFNGSKPMAFADLRVGYAGLLLQVFLAPFITGRLLRDEKDIFGADKKAD